MPRQTTGTKPERDELRSRMLADGCSYEQIANEMRGLWGFRPRTAWRQAYGWTQKEVADRFNQVANDPKASMSPNRISDYETWPLGGVKPSFRALNVLARVYSTRIPFLVDFMDRGAMTDAERIAFGSESTSSLVLSGHNDEPGIRAFNAPALQSNNGEHQAALSRLDGDFGHVVEPDFGLSDRKFQKLILVTTRESIDHAESAMMSGMPEMAIDEIHAEVKRLSREYIYLDSGPLLADIIQIRNKIYRLLERRQYPRQTTHLYYLASVTSLLLANASSGLGMLGASQELSRAAWSYAEIIGHNSLRGLARTFEASFAYEAGRPQRALELALSSEQWAAEAIGKVGLHASIALYSAATGRPSEARSALGYAADALSAAPGDSELFDDIGGVFAYPQVKFRYIETAVHMQLRDSQRAQTSAAQTIEAYETGPAEMLAWGNLAASRIDLAHARLLNGDVDGTRDALDLVFHLPPERRLDWIVQRLKDFYQTLRIGTAALSIDGHQLSTEIEDFCLTTATTMPPNVSL